MSSADPARSTGPTDQSRDAAGLQLGAGVSDQSLDVERDSDVPISTQIYWQIAYQIDSGRLLPGSRLPPVRVLFTECTNADAGYDAERLNNEFEGSIEAEGALLDDLPDRLDRFHYDLVATTTFHADEAQALVHGRVPVVAMLVGPGYVELVHEVAGLKAGSRVGLVCASERGVDNIAETLALSGTTGIEIVAATTDSKDDLAVIDRTADIILMSRDALASGLDER